MGGGALGGGAVQYAQRVFIHEALQEPIAWPNRLQSAAPALDRAAETFYAALRTPRGQIIKRYPRVVRLARPSHPTHPSPLARPLAPPHARGGQNPSALSPQG